MFIQMRKRQKWYTTKQIHSSRISTNKNIQNAWKPLWLWLFIDEWLDDMAAKKPLYSSHVTLQEPNELPIFIYFIKTRNRLIHVSSLVIIHLELTYQKTPFLPENYGSHEIKYGNSMPTFHVIISTPIEVCCRCLCLFVWLTIFSMLNDKWQAFRLFFSWFLHFSTDVIDIFSHFWFFEAHDNASNKPIKWLHFGCTKVTNKRNHDEC